jgi:hypothetical protein
VVPGFGYESGTRKEISKQRQPNVRRRHIAAQHTMETASTIQGSLLTKFDGPREFPDLIFGT